MGPNLQKKQLFLVTSGVCQMSCKKHINQKSKDGPIQNAYCSPNVADSTTYVFGRATGPTGVVAAASAFGGGTGLSGSGSGGAMGTAGGCGARRAQMPDCSEA